ncbi:myosin-11-like [Syngnathus scovelli]|uniref:myosin-11-like n=1 Tax=Syngnathus scovelli TaxID=161590 RepID=UPI0021105AE3|nr:myosin-2 heavy chain, non muscle-like [Syngnathus scovelli]XP_049605888.1 myosin-2 heavy chain, non muscle-like [Syngnathus scovelli]XP_049605889.1 myosin-2 heavy chain, non muscle-like [Syngnathus scovelli]XP_049605890.1 myosin-2 heavy chain, non muscle-like [Syngnathus scovelli]
MLELQMKLAHFQSEISCLQSLQKDNMKEIAEKDLSITKLQASILLLRQERVNTHAQLELSKKQAEQQSLELSACQEKEEILLWKLKQSDANVKQLEEATLSLRASQDWLRRTLALKEQHTQQLLEDEALLENSLDALQNQTSECTVSDIGTALDRARVRLDAGRQMRQQQIQISNEVACLQQEHTHVSCTTQKKFATSQKELAKHQVEDLDLLRRQLKEAREELKGACLQAEEQKEMAVIFKHKYTAAMEKVHKVQGQVKHLLEELQYSQQQLRESQQATHLMDEELSELKRRHHDKVGQWESSQEGLKQLTDELHVSQNLLTESQQTVHHLRSLVCNLQGQVDTLKEQKVVLECDLRLYQQTHAHVNKDYLSMQSNEQKLQKRCSEQVERLVECEKVILQMKSELERQNQEQASLKQSLVTSCRAHLNRRGYLEQEVAQLKEEVTHLQLELADKQKGCMNLLRQSEEALQEARQEAARSCREVGVQTQEVRRLEENLKNAHREKKSLSTQVGRLSQELEELRCKHQTTVEALTARSEEAKRMVACLNEEEQAGNKARVMTQRLELEVAELKRKADLAKRDSQAQVDTLQSKLAALCSDNDKLRHESQLVVTNLKRWITEQISSSKSLAQQMETQSQVLLNVTEDKIHLQEANDTLKAEVKRLKEVVAGQEKEMASIKAQLKDLCELRDKNILDKETCMALNLSSLADMQTRLQGNMDAISLLNQQLNALSEENKHLRRQLEEERSMCTQVEYHRPHPPTSSPSPVVHPFHLAPPPPNLKQATRGIEGI